MKYFYLRHKINGAWLVLGYESETAIGALQQARRGYPEATAIEIVPGTDKGYPRPLPDKTVIVAECFMNAATGRSLR